MTEVLSRIWQPRVDNAWLVAFRVMLGAAICISMLRFIAYGWIDSYFIEPRFLFKYWGFEWVQPMAAPAMHGLFYVLAGLSVCVMLGFLYRIAIWGLLLGFSYIQLLDVTTYLNHYYLATWLLLLLALAPANRNGSIDAWLEPELREATCANGWLWLFRFQIGVIYTFAGLAKAQADWLVHAQPLGIWIGSRTDLPVLGEFFKWSYAPWVMSWAGFLFDTTIAWFLLWRRTRVAAYVAVVAFHTMVGVLFPIGMFPVLMMIGALCFFSPSWPRRLSSKSSRLLSTVSLGAHTALAPASWKLACLALYCAAHVLLPLRHHLYGGNVLWDEQGMRWSWKVMVREKNASLTYVVRDPRSGADVEVQPRRYLTRWQEREMSGQPDLILQLAHHIANEYSARLGTSVQVRVQASASLNGRSPAVLIDPSADLASIHDGVLPARWILPAPTTTPPHLKPI